MTTTRVGTECTGCKEDKPLTPEFYYRSTLYADGLERRCKVCERQRARWRNMLRLYGLTQEDYEALLQAQGGVCAVCRQPPRGGIVAIDGLMLLDIDHDHAEGHVRGLLCRSCNLVLGHVGDSVELLRDLADYLERNTRP